MTILNASNRKAKLKVLNMNKLGFYVDWRRRFDSFPNIL